MYPRTVPTVILGAVILIAGTFLLRITAPSDEPFPSSDVKNRERPPPVEQQKILPSSAAVHPPAPAGRSVEIASQTQAPLDDEASEKELMSELRELGFSQPELTLELARDGNERFQGTESAAERHWFEARALVELQRFEEAQDVGRTMLDTHPESNFTADVRRHLFSNPFGESPRIR